MNGKGNTYRPVDKQKFDRNYERIFGEKATTAPKPCTCSRALIQTGFVNCDNSCVEMEDEHIEFPPLGESNKYGHTCSQCGEFNTHEDIGTYKLLNPECPNCGYNTERDHH